MENQTFTISVYSENNVGLLNRISFLKRHINILSLNVSESEIENVSRFHCSAYHENGCKIL
jgi:acetolactate synthase-1/3 small subunit